MRGRSQLEDVYGRLSDGELEGVLAQRASLTEEAQAALEAVAAERGIASSSVGQDAGAGERAFADLCLLHDAFRAREILRVFTDAGIECRGADLTTEHPDAERSGNGVDLLIQVQVERLDDARALLEQQFGITPNIRVEEAQEAVNRDAWEMLAMFERGDALRVARQLGEQGISYHWYDGKDAASAFGDTETVAIEVRTPDLERAAAVMEAVSSE